MEKDLESVLHHQQLDEQFPNVKSTKLPYDDHGMRNSLFSRAIPCTVTAPTNGALPTFGSSGLPNIKSGQLKESPGWFYCLPRFRQGLIPDTTLGDKFNPKTNLPANENLEEATTPASGTGCVSKQFLVFDQTGNKTTMMFSSGIDTSIAGPTTWGRKPTCFFNFEEGERGIRSNKHNFGPNFTDDLNDDHGIEGESDMPEDSDEIDALLYSDEEDDDSNNGEETSTGHSPSTMTAYEKQDFFREEFIDEVDSSAGPIKRQKISESDYRVPSITYTASHVKLSRSSEYEEDAESSCAGCKPMEFTEMGLLLGNKRMKRKKIHETVSILQTILPSGKGKDAIMVLDEAINYLKTLKFKAESLGRSGCSD